MALVMRPQLGARVRLQEGPVVKPPQRTLVSRRSAIAASRAQQGGADGKIEAENSSASTPSSPSPPPPPPPPPQQQTRRALSNAERKREERAARKRRAVENNPGDDEEAAAYYSERLGAYNLEDVDLSGLKVFVAGASGGVGSAVVDALRQEGVPTRALVRDVERARPRLAGEHTTLVRGDVYQYGTLPGAIGDSNAIVICTGARDFRNPLGPFSVDFQGTLNLIALAKQRDVKKIVLCSSIGADELFNPLNLFWGILFWKKRAEEELQRSGIDYTIVRPGGLKNRLREGQVRGNIVMRGPGAFGATPRKQSGSILRSQVAEVLVAALGVPQASNKVVEVVAKEDAPYYNYEELFGAIHLW